ncbi:sulfatase-like hydrolase/transferase [Roseiconus lacunae]|uniref:sulfatase-like hydrolase/transferase n=1 Tax=Roseiconus lacunae TaxID=2605694 RepID=UPI001E405389|nr:sulfatase-like hydrolase/transferase [Roseiconus lacunae]MCD0461749.1 sulfatase-like hydrolase/transferase [Roseiconus lacunae]
MKIWIAVTCLSLLFAPGSRLLAQADQPPKPTAAPSRAGKSQTLRPNIVMIMADDIGVECLGSYGSDRYKTPHLDRLAAAGLRFENAHAQPICTPSRVQLMTGIYNNENYLRFGVLDPAATTFANELRAAGYATCIAGKWQLSGGFDGPRRFGFDRYCLWQLTRRPSRYPNPGLEIDGKAFDFKNGEFGPDVVSDYLVDFIKQHRADSPDQPFLIYYPMIAPHWPFVPTPDHPDWDPTMWRNKKNEPGGYKGPEYWDAMVQYTDKMVGKVVDCIDENGLGESTLVMWTGDNGTYESVTSKWRGQDYQGGKGKTTDNGTHVGFIARWPGVIEKGTVSDALVDFSDVFPTIIDAAGHQATAPKQLSGQSLLPVFHGDSDRRKKDYIYCWYQRDGKRDQASEHVRTDRFKLYADGRFFDTQADLLEQTDLSGEEMTPDVKETYQRLQKAMAKHREKTLLHDEDLARRRTQVSR